MICLFYMFCSDVSDPILTLSDDVGASGLNGPFQCCHTLMYGREKNTMMANENNPVPDRQILFLCRCYYRSKQNKSKKHI